MKIHRLMHDVLTECILLRGSKLLACSTEL